jgi:hypothetical protein
MTKKDIQDKIKKGEYRFSDHAVKRMIEKSVNRHEVEEAILMERLSRNIPTISIPPALSFMVRLEKGEICMSKFHIPLQSWL